MDNLRPTFIFDIAHECLDSFDHVVEAQSDALLTKLLLPRDGATGRGKQPRKAFDFLGLRNSFLFWVDYTGALSLMESSLDERLRGLTDVSAMVTELLEMILRNLRRVDRKAEGGSFPIIDETLETGAGVSEAHRTFLTRWEDASRAVHDALDRLHTIAVAIRKASAKQLDHSVSTILTDEDISFRKDIASLVRYRFPAARKGLCRQLGDTIAARRRVLLQKKRHSRRLAVRRPQKAIAVTNEDKDSHLKPTRPVDLKGKGRKVSHPTVVTGLTKASLPDPEAPAIARLHMPMRPAITTVMTTNFTSKHDSFEYPPIPKASPGETRVQCPFCFMALERKGSEKEDQEYWKRHVDQDIKPYSCLFPECSESLLFFVHRHEWESHMESVHSRDWLQKVHTMTWFCDMGHDTPLTFETELQWREHMLNPASHPNRKKLPTQAQLDARCPQQQQIAPREQFVCPLCEHIPDEISHKTIKGKLDASRIHSLVVSHVASHIKSLSLMAVPSLETAAIDIDADKESVAFSRDSFRRLLNPESVAHPPSGQEFMEKASLPPQDWSNLHIDDMASHGHISSKVTWDRDFQDYVPSKTPEETSEKEWLIEYKLWRSQHEVLSQADPILDHLRTRQEIEPDVDGQDEAGRTKLSFASQAGNEEEVQRLLRLGASVDLVDQDGQSALLWASFSGHDNIVRLLLEHGASFQIADQIFGRTSLSWAASKGNEAVVHRLLDAGDNADALDNSHRTPLSWAASRGHESIVRILLAANSDCEVEDSRSGRTPLAWAVLKDQPTIVKLLINRGANVDALDKTRRTPLSWAAEEGHTAVVELLIDSGADIESPEPGTLQTPLSLACEEGNADVVGVLLRSGANVAATDSQGWTPLDWALNKGYEEIVKLLVSVGAPSKQLSAA